jgi:aspartate kinase
MKVFKFGGASQKNAQGVRQVGEIIRQTKLPLIVVISAIGKTTNALEEVVRQVWQQKDPTTAVTNIRNEHEKIARELFPDPTTALLHIDSHFQSLQDNLKWTNEDILYDQIVCHGELLASTLLADYLESLSLPVFWKDAREVIATDSHHREGRIDWDLTAKKIESWRPFLEKGVIITQGFIGRTTDGLSTTLGREGSDFSAAILGYVLAAESVTIWKDVPGVMNADPKRIPSATVFDELPYQEAAEMTYFGASVIHPKTIKPLANRGIPLLVKSFVDTRLPGTVIHACKVRQLPPLVVFKENQCLISCKVTDYTFISEENLRLIFMALAEEDIKINVMQNSAISFSFCVDYREYRTMRLIERLSQSFEVYYNTGLELITIKNYDITTAAQYRQTNNILLEQASRSTLQLLVRP